MISQLIRLWIILKMMCNRDYDLAEDVFFYYFLGYYREMDKSLTPIEDMNYE